MTADKYFCKFDKCSRYMTFVFVVLLTAAITALYFFTDGDYLPAWLFSIALAVGLLCTLSIPRFVRIGADSVEIHCIVEITEIPLDTIRSVRQLPAEDTSKLFPLLASYGFFGYFGFYLDVKNWDVVKVYSRSIRSLVEIEDVFEQRYLVGADDPDSVCRAIRQSIDEKENTPNVG